METHVPVWILEYIQPLASLGFQAKRKLMAYTMAVKLNRGTEITCDGIG
uniref:Uncharacterized protein n=1 Tax=Arundo donax TaxID=35708 RepID=A0A0A9HPA8_ARUDO